MFNKQEYWDRRSRGKRGQGDKVLPVPVGYSPRQRPKRVKKKDRIGEG